MSTYLVLGSQVPFTRGGQEALVEGLTREIRKRGDTVDIVALPYDVSDRKSLLKHLETWKSLNLSQFAGLKVDGVIATKFPSYYANHEKKSIWLVHQNRPFFDLYATRFSDVSDSLPDEITRQTLFEGDGAIFKEASFISTISHTVSKRVKEIHEVEATTLYPPLPLGTRYRCDTNKRYVLSVGRICTIKRVDLLIKALPSVHLTVSLKIAGVFDEEGVEDYLRNEIKKHHLENRVEFLGRVSDEELISLYAHALAVYYAPYNEDLGFVTLEAFASGKPVITAKDSGGTLEFVTHNQNGFICDPKEYAIAHAINQCIEDETKTEQMGQHGRSFVETLGIFESTWDRVIDSLITPLK